MSDFITMRYNMVKSQIEPEKVISPLLYEAFFTIPREKFVPRQLSRIAYMDAHFPLGKGRFLLRPAILARLLDALNPDISDKILYIAAGSGYGPALLNKIVSQIIVLDCDEGFTQQIERLGNELKLSSVKPVLGPLTKGWEADAPYDKILIEGCVDYIPLTIISQLKEGGSLIAIKHQSEKSKIAIKIEKKQGTGVEQFLFDAFAPHLKAFQTQKAFVFS